MIEEFFTSVPLTDKQVDDVHKVYCEFTRLTKVLENHLPEGSWRVKNGIDRLHEAKFWFVEAISKEGEL